MQNATFPRWSAPLVGALAGAWIGFQVMGRFKPLVLVVAIGCGALAGCVVFLLEPGTRPKEVPEGAEHLYVSSVENPSGVIGRFLAIVAIAVCLLPICGFVFSLLAMFVNRNVDDWTKPASFICLIVSAMTTAAGIALVIAGR